MATARFASWMTRGALVASVAVLSACDNGGGKDGDGKDPLASTEAGTDAAKPDAPEDAVDDVVVDPATVACLKSKTASQTTPCTCSVYGCVRVAGMDWLCEGPDGVQAAVTCPSTNAGLPLSCGSTTYGGSICNPQGQATMDGLGQHRLGAELGPGGGLLGLEAA